MTRTRKSILLTALLVVSTLTAGVSVAEVSSDEPTYQTQAAGLAEVPVDSGETFWQGTFLRFTANQTNASEVWEIHRVENGSVGSLVTEVLLNGNGSAVFGTSDLSGEFVVVNNENQPVVIQDGVVQGVGDVSEAGFEVATQSLNVSFADVTVRNDDNQAARTDLQVTSNRAEYQLYLLSEQLSASQLAQVFPAVEVRDGRAVTTRSLSGNAVLDANFTGVAPGTYNITVASANGSAEASTSIEVIEPVEGNASLVNRTVTEEAGDVVRLNLTFEGTDRATVRLGSQQVGYVSRFTVVDADGDGRATIAINSFETGLSPDTPGISAVGEDNVTNYRLLTDPIPGKLDPTTYPVAVSVGATRTDVGSILLSERSTDAIQVWTAPDTATINTVQQLTDGATQDSEIAYQDWTIVEVQASGLYGYVQNLSDLNNNTTGLSTTLTNVGEINVPPEQVSLEQWDLLVDESNDRFFLVTDSNTLTRNATYRMNFTVTAENPYVRPGNATSLVTNFTVVPRNTTFDQRPVEVPPTSGATISGQTSLAAGTELTVETANTADSPFLKRQTVTVSENGTWEATFDFSDVEAGTNFTVELREPLLNATGVVVGEGGAVAAEETPTETTTTTTTTTAADADAAEETTAAEDAAAGAAEEDAAGAAEEDAAGAAEEDAAGAAEETTAAADGAAEEDAAAEETIAADGAAEETTTEAAALAPVSSLGGSSVAMLAGLAVLLVGGAFASRRRL